MGVGRLDVLAGLAADSLWLAPWKLIQTGLREDWTETMLVGAFVALCIVWGVMDRQTSLRFWLGVLTFAVGVKIVIGDGPMARTVTDAVLYLPRAAEHAFR